MVLSDFGVTGTNPSTLITPLTSIKYFPRSIISGSVFGAAPASTPSAINATGQLNYNGPSGQNLLNGQMVRIRAVGNASSIVSVNVIVTLQANTGTLSNPNYLAIAQTGAFTIPGNGGFSTLPPVAKPWSIECVVSGDSASGFVQGQYSAITAGAYNNIHGTSPWVILESVIPNTGSINLNPVSGVPFGLVVGVTFGTGNFANAASLFQFQILDI